MTKPNSQSEKPKDERRYDPELLKKGLHCDLDQYEMLERCSDKKDMTEWNNWRIKNQKEDIWLQGVNLAGMLLEGADLAFANLESANLQDSKLKEVYLTYAHLDEAKLRCADLERAKLPYTHLERTDFLRANLKGAILNASIVDGSTLFWKCRVDNKTDFRGVGLNSCRIDEGIKQLLEYNIRRMNWEAWYEEHRISRWPVRWFWLLSDYGLRTWWIIAWFFGLAVAFALAYWLLPSTVMVNCKVGDIRGLWHAIYFSVVTMTTLGFGDIAANPDSWLGQTLLMFQVILGYVLLGALVTRFAVLFTAGGPAGKFADEKEKKDKTQ
ncbi:MAG: pentapeptide repeat-containing protein [Planctomycetota bacterium]